MQRLVAVLVAVVVLAGCGGAPAFVYPKPGPTPLGSIAVVWTSASTDLPFWQGTPVPDATPDAPILSTSTATPAQLIDRSDAVIADLETLLREEQSANSYARNPDWQRQVTADGNSARALSEQVVAASTSLSQGGSYALGGSFSILFPALLEVGTYAPAAATQPALIPMLANAVLQSDAALGQAKAALEQMQAAAR